MPKLTIEFDETVNKLLNTLSESKGTSKAEIIRRALATYKYLTDETKEEDKRVSVTTVSTSTKPAKIIKDVLLP